MIEKEKAYHEGGHAIVGTERGTRVAEIVISETGSYVRWAELSDLDERHAITLMAGRIAQMKYLQGRKQELVDAQARKDFEDARFLLSLEFDEADVEWRLKHAERVAHAYVEKYWRLISALAEHLVEPRALCRSELLAFLERHQELT